MGVRQSKRSVDISGTPKKGEAENGGGQVAADGSVLVGKLEKIVQEDEAPGKAALNGTTPHPPGVNNDTKAAAAAGDAAAEPAQVNGEVDAKTAPSAEAEDVSLPAEGEAAAAPVAPELQNGHDEAAAAAAAVTASPEKKKKKKKFSFRSFSFSRKDKKSVAKTEEAAKE
ncbi:hypothetical protein B566_EDAN005439, partial [Ephemera danica]